MKRFSCFLLVGVLLVATAGAQQVSINEIKAANGFEADDAVKSISDWVELYNAGPESYQLLGTRLVINGVRHMIDAPMVLPAYGYLILWCDGEPSKGPDHIRSKLPRARCTVELIATDGTTLLDSVSYTELDLNYSLGRAFDGEGSFLCFETPSPGAANRYPGLPPLKVQTPHPNVPAGIFYLPFELELTAGVNDDIRFTTDGTLPGPQSQKWKNTLTIDATSTIRAIAFRKGTLPSEEFRATYLLDETLRKAIHLTTDPSDLWDDTTGIYTQGVYANNTRTGKSWERPMVLQFLHADTPDTAFVGSFAGGLRISGSGSRGLAKRSFKVYARDGYSGPGDGFLFDSTYFSQGILRADASPNAFLHNTIMEAVVRSGDMAVEVQHSTTWPLYLNGVYWGLYRWMPPKNQEWLRSISGSEKIDLLSGPSARAISGSHEDLYYGIGLIEQQASIEEIAEHIDVASLIDMACLDLFTGRADHDLNVRCYRSYAKGGPGPWRWILFDMDLWSTPEENSIQRMCMSTELEAPYVPQLLAHPQLRDLLLTRIITLNATTLDPFHLQAITDSIYQANSQQLAKDHARWEGKLDRPTPADALEEVHEMIVERGPILLRQIAQRTGHTIEQIMIDVPDAKIATMYMNGVPLAPGRTRVQLFKELPTTIEVVPAEGQLFTEWNWHGTEPSFTLNENHQHPFLRPQFQTEEESGQFPMQKRVEQNTAIGIP